MESYGELFHRNGAHLLPGWLARLIIGVAICGGIVEFVLGLISIVR